MDQTDSAVLDLLKVSREMLDYIRKDRSGRPRRVLIVETAKDALKRAEIEILWTGKKPRRPVSPHFGRLGFRYDFQLEVTVVQKMENGYRLECVDQQGRDYTVRAQDDAVHIGIRPGMNLFFRGKITDQRIVKSKPVTFVEVISGLQKVSSHHPF
jgi:hypothetical protein